MQHPSSSNHNSSSSSRQQHPPIVLLCKHLVLPKAPTLMNMIASAWCNSSLIPCLNWVHPRQLVTSITSSVSYPNWRHNLVGCQQQQYSRQQEVCHGSATCSAGTRFELRNPYYVDGGEALHAAQSRPIVVSFRKQQPGLNANQSKSSAALTVVCVGTLAFT